MARRPEEPSRELGARLRELRRERDLTQETLAERIGMEVGNYAHVEQGVANPTLRTLTRVAAALDVPVFELFRPPRERAVRIGRPAKPKRGTAATKRAELRALHARAGDEKTPIDDRVEAARKYATLLKRTK